MFSFILSFLRPRFSWVLAVSILTGNGRGERKKVRTRKFIICDRRLVMSQCQQSLLQILLVPVAMLRQTKDLHIAECYATINLKRLQMKCN